ncbi:MAG: prolyl oligopeptidase family serine peptidase, partial [Gammaproteobacteria bacterium]|nr:prolyl oligopeptidase family serine peptidase [Gammaproteobacteria bacterium]
MLLTLTTLLCGFALADDIVSRAANNGNLIMEDIPEIPQSIVDDLNRYQNVRSAGFVDWTPDGQSIYVRTRFGDVSQLHRVDMPGGARRQLTFFEEPIGNVSRRPDTDVLLFTMDAGGSEFAQIFLFDPATAEAEMLSDGESRNGAILWNRDGSRFAFQSTRRNGRSNDIWVMDPEDPSSARVVLESPDGTWWGPVDFDASGNNLLVLNYVSAADSRMHLLDLESGDYRLLAGGPDNSSTNFGVGFDANDQGYWLVTDQAGEFRQLARQSLQENAEPEIITEDIAWDIGEAALSHDRKTLVFSANEGGLSRVYLLQTRSKKFSAVEGIPTGVAGSFDFSPDDSKIGMTLNTPQTPSDSFVLSLPRKKRGKSELSRWTYSEVGGLNTDAFVAPELISYETFDGRSIPAWLYKPTGAGPHPVVISIHGGPEGQATPRFSSTYQMWIEKLGVAVIVPNVRGSAGYGKTYLSLDNGFNREDSVKDIGALLDWVGGQPDLDKERVAVFGGSYGGYMVLASGVHYSDRLKAAVDIVGISNFVTFLENTQDYRRDLRRVEYGDERDPAMRAHLQKISPLNNVEKIAVPMLIVQGQNDPRVPVTEAEQIVAALRGQGLT